MANTSASPGTEADAAPGSEADAAPEEQKSIEVTVPIVIDLGKQRRKRIKALKQGKGRLTEEVIDVVTEVHAELGDEAEGKTLVPVVIVYERKRKRNRRVSLFPL